MKLALLTIVLGFSQAAFGSAIWLTFDTDTLSGSPGSMVTFRGTLTNTTNIEQNLNSADFSGLLAGFDVDTTPFLLNAPLSLLGNQTVGSFDMFTVTIPNAAAAGPVSGFFTILGGPGFDDQTILTSATFTVNVTPVTTSLPEPSSFGLAFAGLMTIGMVARRSNEKQDRQ